MDYAIVDILDFRRVLIRKLDCERSRSGFYKWMDLHTCWWCNLMDFKEAKFNSQFHYGIRVYCISLSIKRRLSLHEIQHEIPLWPKPIAPISIHCDNQATLARPYNHVYNCKSRHNGLRHSCVRELITNGVITIDYVKSSQNLADPFTKGLLRDLVNKTSRGMGLKPMTENHQ